MPQTRERHTEYMREKRAEERHRTTLLEFGVSLLQKLTAGEITLDEAKRRMAACPEYIAAQRRVDEHKAIAHVLPVGVQYEGRFDSKKAPELKVKQ